jgi:hypothetical protein
MSYIKLYTNDLKHEVFLDSCGTLSGFFINSEDGDYYFYNHLTMEEFYNLTKSLVDNRKIDHTFPLLFKSWSENSTPDFVFMIKIDPNVKKTEPIERSRNNLILQLVTPDLEKLYAFLLDYLN